MQVVFSTASQTFLFCHPISEKFFLGDTLMDSLDVNDAFKRPISLQKHL